MSVISVEVLMQINERVFGQRESTLEEEASAMSVPDLKRTVLVIRRMLKSAAAALPETAYARQPDDQDGNDVWSAGEIASHIAGTMIWTDTNLRKLRGLEASPPEARLASYAEVKVREKAAEVKVREKAAALQALEVADTALTGILDDIPHDIDTSQTEEFDFFGTVGVKGWLLLTALHEGDHANQLRELGRSSVSG